MSDKEIIDALGQCERMTTCSGCPYFEKVLGCKKHLYQDAFHLINRQQEEIERLKRSLDNMTDALIRTDDYCRDLECKGGKDNG